MYDKPKITIDLDEYNDLLKLKETVSSDEQIIAAKKVVFSIIRNRGNVEETKRDMAREGIVLAFMSNYSSNPSFNDVIIKVEKK